MKKYFKIAVSVVLIAVMLISLCSCKKNPSMADLFFGEASQEASSGQKTEIQYDERQLSDDVPQPIRPIGNSKPFSVTVDDVLTVSGDENILFEDTNLIVTPLTDPLPEVEAQIRAFEELSQFPIGAWEIEGGLESDEHFPGMFKMTFDLDALGVDKSMYDSLAFYRIDDDGNTYEYLHEIKDNQAIVSTSQNSIVLLVLGSVALGETVGYGIQAYQAEKYYYEEGRSCIQKDYETNGGKYTIVWSPTDFASDYNGKRERMKEIENEARKQANGANASPSFGSLLYNGVNVARICRSTIENCNEYQKLASEMVPPEFINVLSEQINKAFYYLSSVAEVKMPEYVVTFYVRSDIDELGTEVSSSIKHSYIQIGLKEIDKIMSETDKTEYDNLLLTVTHELFHLCQEYYHYEADKKNTKFDEMVAIVLESDARDYYKEKGEISAWPDITPRDNWDLLKIPVDDISIATSKAIHQGYNLSYLVMALREKTGKKKTAKNLMDSLNYYWEAAISEPLMNTFGISERTFDSVYRDFATDNRKIIGDKYLEVRNAPEHPQLKARKLSSEPLHISVGTEEEYWIGIQGLCQPNANPCALLIVIDKNMKIDHPECVVVPAEPYANTSFGAFLPIKPIKDPHNVKERFRVVMECHGALGGRDSSAESGYTVISMFAPEKPSVSIKDGKLVMEQPAQSAGMKGGYLEGYRLTLYLADGNKEIEIPKTANQTAWTDGLFNYIEDKDTTFSASISEYLTDVKGEKFYGPESEKTVISYKKEEPTATPMPTETPTVTEEAKNPAGPDDDGSEDTEKSNDIATPTVTPAPSYAWHRSSTKVEQHEDSKSAAWLEKYTASEGYHTFHDEYIEDDKYDFEGDYIATCSEPPAIIYPNQAFTLNITLESSGNHGNASAWCRTGIPTGSDGGYRTEPKYETADGDSTFTVKCKEGEAHSYDVTVYGKIAEGSKEGELVYVIFTGCGSDTIWIYEWRK